MKRVAFLSFDWDYTVVSEYYLGLQDHLKKRSDIRLVIFNAFGLHTMAHTPKESYFEIFTLFDPADYDGILIQGNRTWPPELRQQVVDEVIALGKPVVSINYDLAGAHCVGTDNYQEEFDFVTRIIIERGCKHPAFVNGLRTSIEAQDRARAYRDACERLGIKDVRFYQANWQMEAGVVTAKKMLHKPNDLPDVIFCCNDDLAVGVQETLRDAGIHVPESVMVAGFDNSEIGQTAQPRISTIDRDYRSIAETSLRTLVRLMEGGDVPTQVHSPAKHILAESCRYRTQNDDTHPQGKRAATDDLRRFFSVLAEFQHAVLDANTLYAVLENCEEFAEKLDCPSVCLSLNDSFMCADVPEDATSYAPTSHLVAYKQEGSTLHCDGNHVYAAYATRDILPPEMPSNRHLYMVSPLRHNNICVGTVVTEGVPKSISYGLGAYHLSMLASAIVAARKNELLQAAYARLGK